MWKTRAGTAAGKPVREFGKAAERGHQRDRVGGAMLCRPPPPTPSIPGRRPDTGPANPRFAGIAPRLGTGCDLQRSRCEGGEMERASSSFGWLPGTRTEVSLSTPSVRALQLPSRRMTKLRRSFEEDCVKCTEGIRKATPRGWR